MIVKKKGFLALEPRILLDGAIAATLADQHQSDASDSADAETGGESQNLQDFPGTGPEAGDSGRDAAETRHEVMFVDEALLSDEGFALSVAQLQQSRPDITVVNLGRSGLDTITETLQLYADVGVRLDNIHIMSHSSAGKLGLGGDELDSRSLAGDDAVRDKLATWKQAIAADGDIFLYGCDLAAGPEGIALVDSLSALTGADVAASTDPTGAADKGGDWELEYRSGEIGSPALTMQAFNNTLSDAYNVAQIAYVPLSETDISTALKNVNRGVSGSIETVISIAVTTDNTKIVYDHWEDGYETDLKNPTQGSTEIWGDGDTSNGVAPGDDGDDILVAGQSIILKNSIDPSNPGRQINGDYAYNGRDKIGSERAVAVTRASWSSNPGTVLAGSVNVIDSGSIGRAYTLPVGQNVTTNQLFEFTTAHIIATQDNTTVTIDKDGNGSTDLTITLNEGDTYMVNGGMNAGGKIVGDKDIGVYLIAGDVGSSYENRWFTLTPDGTWSDSYYAPVSTISSNDAVYVFFYNPGSSGITINYDTATQSGLSVSVGAKSSAYIQMPSSAAHFYTTNGDKFYALSTHDSGSRSNQDYDWSYSLVPEDYLTNKLVVAWGPGNNSSNPANANNASPVWVTAAESTTLYIDYQGDGTHDATYDIGKLESYRVFDNSDNDQTGMVIYTTDGTLITGAWGEDPTRAYPGNPYLDMGYTISPFPDYVLSKSSKEASIGSDGDGDIELGEQIEYTIRIRGRSVTDLYNARVTDLLSPGAAASYVAGSTYMTVYDEDGTTKLIDNVQIADIGSGAFNGFPLLSDGNSGTSTDGYTITDTDSGTAGNQGLGKNQEIVISYRVQVSSNAGDLPADAVISNTAELDDGSGNPKQITNRTNVVITRDDGEVKITDSGFNTVSNYKEGSTLYIQVEDDDPNTDDSVVNTLNVLVTNNTSGETEALTLTETGVNTGIFRGTLASSTSVSHGTSNSGTLQMTGGNSIKVEYTDPVFGPSLDSPSNYDNDTGNGATTGNPNVVTFSVTVDSKTKVLYLSDDGADGDTSGNLDRVDPDPAHTGTADNTTSTSASLGSTSLTITDDFESNDYSGGSGWSGSWTESDSGNQINVGTESAAGGTHGLQFGLVDTDSSASGSIERSFSQALTASGTLSFNYRNYGMGTSDTLKVQYWDGDSWELMATIEGKATDSPTTPAAPSSLSDAGFTAFNSASATVNVSGTNVIPAGAEKIRFVWDVTYGSDDKIYVDDVSITSTGTAAPVTFTQSTPMATDFAMPSGGAVKVVTNISDISGLTDGNSYSDITAALTYEDGSSHTIANMGSATYSSTDATLTWNGVLSGDMTIPDGANVKLVITNNETGAGFRIDYDSASDPSRIELPTTTVIDIVDADNNAGNGVQEIGFYDNSFAASGSLNTAATASAGETVYLRVRVGDPFGEADISKLDLVLDGPDSAGDLSVTLSDANLVDSGSDGDAYKTYEYAWNTVYNPGEYTATVTAHEGFEGDITDVATSTFNITALDLGTPAILQFIDSLGGAVSGDTYDGGDQAFIRLTDLDENTDTGVAETVKVTINGTEFTLTETGVNTGKFELALTGAVTGVSNLASLSQGNLLTASYVDDDDSSDTATDSISVPVPANNAPVAQDNAKTIVANQTASGNVISDNDGSGVDSDADSDTMTVVGVNGSGTAVGNTITLASGATVEVQANGSYTYDPNGVFNYLSGINGSDSFTYTISDGNGATSTATVTITITPWNRPTIYVSTKSSVATLTVDDSDLTTDATAGFAASFNSIADYGADGQGGGGVSSSYALSISASGADSGLDDSATGENVLLRMNGASVEGYTASSNDLVFTVTVDASGNVELDQLRAVKQSDTSSHDDAATLASSGLVRLTRSDTITDATGDTANASAVVNLGSVLQFRDDGPSLSASAPGDDSLQVDESDLSTNATMDYSGLFTSLDGGADGQASLSYSVGVSSSGVDSGVDDAATGNSIYLYMDGSDVVGRVGSGASTPDNAGAIAFRVSVSNSGGDAGKVTLDQIRAVKQSNTASANEEISLNDSALTLSGTLADKDGDTAVQTVNLGGALSFLDDGPSLSQGTVTAGSLEVDESTLSTDATVSFTGAFSSVSAGADGQGSLIYGLGVSSAGVDSGVDDAATGNSIYLYMDGSDVVGRVGSGTSTPDNAGAIAFRLSVSNSGGDAGKVTLDQVRALTHSNTASANEALGLDSSVISLSATLTDNDGDTASETVDLSGALSFRDDGPSLSQGTVTAGSLEVDESALSTDATVSFTGAFSSVSAGADGQASLAYSLGVASAGVDSGLDDAEAGEDVLLRMNGATVEGYLASNDALVFTVSVASNGDVTLDQRRALKHTNTGSADEASSLNGSVISLTATMTDKDGDAASETVDLSGALSFRDDGPSLSAGTATANSLQVDESDLSTNATVDYSSLFSSVAAGADGQKSLVYSLVLSASGADSGVDDVATGNSVFVYLESGNIVGRVGSDATTADPGGAVAFTLSVDNSSGNEGKVTLDQQRALKHSGTGASHNETLNLNSSVVSLRATLTDSDDDSASQTADLGGAISFLDDGPSLSAAAPGDDSLQVDESDLSTNATVDYSGLFTSLDGGADGQGSLVYGLGVSSAGVDSGVDDAATGNSIYLYMDGNDVVGRVGSGASTPDNAGAIAFRVSVSNSGGDAGKVTLDQVRAVKQSNTASANEEISLNGSALTLSATLTDGDDDTAVQTVNFGGALSFLDDGPSLSQGTVTAGSLEVDESTLSTDATVSFTGAFSSVNAGADGQGSLAYSLSVSNGTDSGVDDAATGENVLLRMNGATVEGYLASNSAVVFALSVDSNGDVTLDQRRAVKHTNTGSADESTGLNGSVVSLTATVTDNDGDTASETVDLSGALSFRDDGPGLSQGTVTAGSLEVDESALSTDATVSFTGAFSSVSAGADGQGSLVYSLGVASAGVDSGVDDAETGENVLLRMNGATVEAYLASNDALVFTLSVASSGDVTLDQRRALKHADTGSANEALGLNASVISLSATLTDNDGDAASETMDLSGALSFRDDGPSLNVGSVSADSLQVDESDLGTDSTVSFASLFTGISAGSDGLNSQVYGFSLSSAGVDSGVDDMATGNSIYLYMDGNDVVGRVGSGASTPDNSGAIAFRLSVSNSGGDAGKVTLDQQRALKHSSSGANHDDDVNLNASAVSLTLTLTDKDGDTTTGSLDLGAAVSFKDDGPALSVGAASANSLQVDESSLSTDATTDYSGLFSSIAAGTDGQKSLVYSLALSSAGVDSGVDDAATGNSVFLYLESAQVVGRVGSGAATANASGAIAFTLSVDNSSGNEGKVTLDQQRALKHPTGGSGSYDEAISLSSNVISLKATLTDNDDDTASQSADLGGAISFKDDGPSLSVGAVSANSLQVDESSLSTDATTDYSGLFSSIAAGADGQASLIYSLALSASAVDSGVDDAATGNSVFLYLESGAVVGRVGSGAATADAAGAIAFRLSADNSSGNEGKVTLDQQRALKHPTGGSGSHDEALSLNGSIVSLVATLTDNDGDTASQSADLGAAISFKDDGPSLSAGSVSANSLQVDESDLSTDATVNYSGLFSSIAAGADGQKSLVYSLGVSSSGVDSGVDDVATGNSVFLYLESGQVVGRVGSGASTANASGAVAFTLSVNNSSGNEGKVTLDQQRALKHPTGGSGSYDEAIGLNGNVISLTATLTDNDDDTAAQSADLSAAVSFRDDGPTLTVGSVTADSVQVDESDLSTDATIDLSSLFTSFSVGNDGETSRVYNLAVASAGVDSGVDDTATGNSVFLYLESGQIVGRVGSGASTANASGAVAFTLSVDNSSGNEGKVTLDQKRELKHPTGGSSHDEAINLNAAALSLTVTLTDRDGDTATRSINLGNAISFRDEGPQAVADVTDALEDGAAVTGNILTNDSRKEITATLSGATLNGKTITLGTSFTTDAGGTLRLNADGSYSYTPPESGEVGAEGLAEEITYTITDADGDTSDATFTIRVGDVDLLPEANADQNSAREDGSAVGGNVIDNDKPGDPDAKVVSASTSAGSISIGQAATTAAGGTLVLNADGSYNYTPPTGKVPLEGLTEVISYTIADEDGDQSSSTLTIQVQNTVHDPEAADDSREVSRNGTNPVSGSGNLLQNDSDEDDETLKVISVGGNTGAVGGSVNMKYGTLSVAADGSYTFTLGDHPDVRALGVDESLSESIGYSITNESGGSASATLTIVINGQNTPPEAVGETITVKGEGPYVSTPADNLLLNDTDENDDDLTVVPQNRSTGNGGSIVINADGSYVYTPPPGFVGTETIEYTIEDGQGGSDTATLTIIVELLQAQDDVNSAVEDGPAVGGNVLQNDQSSDPVISVLNASQNGTPLVIGQPFATAAGGSITISADGSYSYQPPEQDNVPDVGLTEVFTYTIRDTDGDVSSATLSIVVSDTPVIRPPETQPPTPQPPPPPPPVDVTPETPNTGNPNVVVENGVVPTIEQVVNRPFPVSLVLTAQMQDRVISEGTQSFSIPANAFEHSNPGEPLSIQATLADGAALPDYISFDQENGSFTIDADEARRLNVEGLDIRISATDTHGNEVSTVFRVVLTEQGEQQILPTADGDQQALPEVDGETDESGDVQGEGDESPDQEGGDEAQDEDAGEQPQENEAAEETAALDPGKAALREQVKLASKLGFQQESRQLVDDLVAMFGFENEIEIERDVEQESA